VEGDIEDVAMVGYVGDFAGEEREGKEDEDGEEGGVVEEAPVGAGFLRGAGGVRWESGVRRMRVGGRDSG
jgi:hypothetical protein